MDLEIEGLEEFSRSLEAAVNLYPEIAKKEMQKAGTQFVKRARKNTEEMTKTRTGKLKKGYKKSRVKNTGMDMEVDIRGTAPHYHLVNNGHRQVTKNGVTIGTVKGRKMMEKTREEYGVEFPQVVEKILTGIIRQADL